METLGTTPEYLVPPSVVRADGVGPVIELCGLEGKLLVLSLAINDVIEHEGLAISIYGSESGTEWEPLLTLPEKSYCGVYTTFLNLAKHASVRYLRVEWKMRRWDQRHAGLLFGFQISVRPSRSQFHAAA